MKVKYNGKLSKIRLDDYVFSKGEVLDVKENLKLTPDFEIIKEEIKYSKKKKDEIEEVSNG